MAVSYSGRQDLTLAAQELARRCAAGELAHTDITPAHIADLLATRQLPSAWQQPDLLVRTSGERRLSNFLTWESAYSGARGGLGPRAAVAADGPARTQCVGPLDIVALLPHPPPFRPVCFAELYFSDALWPDFREAELASALRDYAHRERRFGGRRQREASGAGGEG